MCTSPQARQNLEGARTLLEALKEKKFREFDLSWAYSRGPHCLRDKRELMPVLNLLTDYGWLKVFEIKRTGAARPGRYTS